MTSRGRIRAFVELEMGRERVRCRKIEFNVCFSDLQKHFSNIHYAKHVRDNFSPSRRLLFMISIQDNVG